MNARDEVLARITAANRTAPPPPAVPRDYRHSTNTPAGSRAAVDLLAERLRDYRATVQTCRPAELPAAIATALTGSASVVVPTGLDPTWTTALTGIQIRPDDPPLSHADLDRTDAVLTACRVAIAETGTIVLDGAPDQGRRALTLLPDRHVCIVRTDQIVGSVPEAVTILARQPHRPLTWISGPSATSDIELVRVQGVHGPRDLRVILVTGG
ncbi:LutC/YkgG family protein [Cellulomonas sp. SG140]|uniref:LutC/YkgG family protein n=1 Tax=Cellulomonas sp. SG140 TaxID=2976536 RepID=UPI0021E81F7F|nr:lactate utilization protein C [Cellulomonas sp. SG140]